MKDLTKCNISKVILQFAIPIFLGQIIQIFYGITDTWIIGRILGDNALAAVGAVTPINDLIVGFLIGLTNGFAIITAQLFGAKDKEGLNKSFAASLLFGTLTALILTIISIAFLPNILSLINIAPEHIDNGTKYIRVILFGMIASMLYNVYASTLRAMGDTKAPLIFLVISAILNIVLDYMLVGSAHMGVAGASIATVFSQLISALLCFVYIQKKYPILHLTKMVLVNMNELELVLKNPYVYLGSGVLQLLPSLTPLFHT